MNFKACFVTRVACVGHNLQLVGTHCFPKANNHVMLRIQLRGTEQFYHYPISLVEENNWTATINFYENKFPLGTWDYYLEYKSDCRRLKFSGNSTYVKSQSFFYMFDEKTREMSCYITKKHSFSTRSITPTIKVVETKTYATEDSKITIEGNTNNTYIRKHDTVKPMKLLLIERGSANRIELPIDVFIPPTHSDSPLILLHVNYEYLLDVQTGEEARWDIYLKLHIQKQEHILRMKLVDEYIIKKTIAILHSPHTKQVYFYTTKHGNLSIACTNFKVRRDLIHFSFVNNLLRLQGYADLQFMNLKAENKIVRKVIVRNNSSKDDFHIPIEDINGPYTFSEDTFNENGFFQVDIEVTRLIESAKHTETTFDIFLFLQFKNAEVIRKVGCIDSNYKNDEVPETHTYRQAETYYNIYVTFTPNQNIRLMILPLTQEKHDFLERQLKKPLLPFFKRKIWLIGERPDTAQDTGYHFFKYCREHYPKEKIYYIINKDSADLKRVNQLGNVVYHGSMEHFLLTARATTFIGSHDLEYILPTKAVDWPSYQKGKRIFLQHGVLGRKNVHYYKDKYIYPFTKFCVSSESELQLVIKTLGYNTDEVSITGLSRFDHLLVDRAETNSILIIPTWRDWIHSEKDFLTSNYYLRFQSLLRNKTFQQLLNETNSSVTFYLHFRMQQYSKHLMELATEKIDIVPFDQYTVQELLKRSKLLITDYSSVSFDFNYMGKPVIFYQIDHQRFFRQGMLRPMKETFLGDICYEENELISRIAHYIKNNFTETPKWSNIKSEVFNYIDCDNCSRIYNMIKNS